MQTWASYAAEPDAFWVQQEASSVSVNTGHFACDDCNEEGFILVNKGNPKVYVGEQSCVARPFDLFHFPVGLSHGVLDDNGVVTVFHGNFQGQYQK